MFEDGTVLIDTDVGAKWQLQDAWWVCIEAGSGIYPVGNKARYVPGKQLYLDSGWILEDPFISRIKQIRKEHGCLESEP